MVLQFTLLQNYAGVFETNHFLSAVSWYGMLSESMKIIVLCGPRRPRVRIPQL